MSLIEKDVKERLRIALATYGKNPTNLSKEHGLNQKTLNNQLNGNTSVSLSTILLILQTLPDVSSEWLLRGTGDMLLSKGNKFNEICSSNSNTASLPESFVRGLLAEKDKQIQSLLNLLEK